MAGRKRLPNGWVLLVIGIGVGTQGLFMFRDGQHHKQQYEDFQACKASSSTVCVLKQDGSQALSEGAFKKNYENQFLIGTVAISVGGLLALGGVVILAFFGRPSRPPQNAVVARPAAQVPQGPPAGWYPDPANPAERRWWDGSRWTEQTAGPPPK